MHGVYPGSFDPITKGHLDIIRRAAGLCQQLTIGIGRNSRKAGLFSEAERIGFIEEGLADLENVEVRVFSGLIVDFAHELGAEVLVRGLRNGGDFEFEMALAVTNRSLVHGIETLFLVASPEYAFVSSSLIKEIVRHGGDATRYVSAAVQAGLRQKLANS